MKALGRRKPMALESRSIMPPKPRHSSLEFLSALWPLLSTMIVTPLSMCFRQPWIGIIILMGIALAYKRWWTCVFGLLNFIALAAGVVSCSIFAIKLLTR